MPIYMDRHDIPGVTAKAVAEAHHKDLKIQDRFNCKGLTYWFDEEKGMAFCLIEAPDRQSVQELHNYAHGLIPNKVIEVESALVEAFLGRIEDPDTSESADLPVINDPAFRVVMAAFPDPSVIDKSTIIPDLFQKAVDSHSGQLVEHDKTFLLASFKNAHNSVECAMEFQQNLGSINREKSQSLQEWRIGLSAGVPVSEDESLFGQTVKNATRLGFIARPNAVLISSQVAENFNGDVISPFHVRTNPAISAIDQRNERLLNTMMDVIEQSGNEPDFNVAQFAKSSGMSKSQLYRKIRSLTGYTPNDFIREFRLRKAAVQMKRQTGSVSEIAYANGFSSLSYFSKCFSRRFGLLPSAFS